MAPLIARARGVPLEGLAVQPRVLHPVVLAVHHVVPDLHVVEDLRQGQGDGAADPRGRQEAEEQQPAACALQSALGADDLVDVVGVALAEVRDDAGADRVELLPERLELLRREAGRWSGHDWLLLDVGVHRSSATSPTGTDTQIRMCSSLAVESSPVMTFRTVPAVL